MNDEHGLMALRSVRFSPGPVQVENARSFACMQGVMFVTVLCNGNNFVFSEFEHRIPEFDPGCAMWKLGNHIFFRWKCRPHLEREAQSRCLEYWIRQRL